jgi:hypothetical protein
MAGKGQITGKYGKKVSWNVKSYGKFWKIVKRYEKYGRNPVEMWKWYEKYGRKASWIVLRNYGRQISWIVE